MKKWEICRERWRERRGGGRKGDKDWKEEEMER